MAKDAKLKESKPAYPLQESFIRLYRNLGRIYKIYEGVKIIDPFIQVIKKLLVEELLKFPVRYLEKKSEPEDDKHRNE